MFDIRVDRLLTSIEAASAGAEAFGRITVGDFSERFLMSLSYWSPEDYERHWHAALLRLATTPDATSCLISSTTRPTDSNFVFCWPLYRERDVVHVQIRILFLHELDGQLDLEQPWTVLGVRESVTDEGVAISEWTTGIEEIRSCLRQQNSTRP